MDFAPTPEQVQLRDSVRGFLGKYSPESEVRRLMDGPEGYDPAVWQRMARDMGLQGLIIPEEYGGSGASWRDLGIVLEELGRALTVAPFFATVVLGAVTILESGDTAAQARLLPGIADGTTIATVALTDDSGNWGEPGDAVTASGSAGQYRLTGRKSYVLDGHAADLIIVPVRTAGGTTLFTVRGDAVGLSRTLLSSLDLTRKLARLDFADVAAEPLGAVDAGWPVLERVLDFAAVGLAAEQAGGARAALDMAVEYAKLRVQFGQVIGSFQSIKHLLADLLLEVESAKSAADYALWAASEGSGEFPAAASLAQAYCSDAYVLAAHQNIQVHGGIGYTWEVPPHLHFKRAKSMELYLGEPDFHRERLAQRIGA
jgi:alkylation response protein AidB-like acyl-CoA dehydrogenase